MEHGLSKFILIFTTTEFPIVIIAIHASIPGLLMLGHFLNILIFFNTMKKGKNSLSII